MNSFYISFICVLILYSCFIKNNQDVKELIMSDTVKVIADDSITVNTIYENNTKKEQYITVNGIVDGGHYYFNELGKLKQILYISKGYILSFENYHYTNNILDSVIIYSYLKGEKKRSGEYFSIDSIDKNSNWYSLNDNSPFLRNNELTIKKNTSKKALLILGDYSNEINGFEEYSDTIPFRDSIKIELKGKEILKRISGQIIFLEDMESVYKITNRMFFVQYFRNISKELVE